MNTRQLALRLKHLLMTRRWHGSGSADRVFAPGSIRITQMAQQTAWDRLVLPAVFIRIGSSRSDDQEPGLLQQDFDVVVVCSEPGGLFGEEALIGAHQDDDDTGRGRGLLEVEEQLFAVIGELSDKDGIDISHRADGAPTPEMDETRGYMVARAYRYRARVGSASTHLPARTFAAAEAGGTVTLTWAAPRDTTDLVDYVVRRASGGLPPARPDEGTDIYAGALLTTPDAPGSGTWSYAVFARYADPGGSVALHYTDFAYVTVEVP